MTSTSNPLSPSFRKGSVASFVSRPSRRDGAVKTIESARTLLARLPIEDQQKILNDYRAQKQHLRQNPEDAYRFSARSASLGAKIATRAHIARDITAEKEPSPNHSKIQHSKRKIQYTQLSFLIDAELKNKLTKILSKNIKQSHESKTSQEEQLPKKKPSAVFANVKQAIKGFFARVKNRNKVADADNFS